MAQQSLPLRHSTRSAKLHLLMAGHELSETPNLPERLQRVECPEPVEGLAFVYILRCRNGTFYVGHSSDISKRIKRHQDGSGARHTRQLKEFSLVYVEGPLEPNSAIKRERQLKRWTRAKKTALIKGELVELKLLSQSHGE